MAENRKPKVSHDALVGYLDVVEGPKVQGRRYLALIMILSVTVLVLAIGLAATAPLKERVPYFVEVETATGRVDVSTRIAQEFHPSEASIRFFLHRWIIDTFTIDEATRTHRLPASWAMMRGPGRDQWNRIVLETDDPLKRLSDRPSYRRSVEFVTPPQIVGDGSAIVRIALVEGRNVVERRQVSLRFVLLPPTDDTDLLRNPIGLWITDFGVVDEAL